jgi:hypothetical protein
LIGNMRDRAWAAKLAATADAIGTAVIYYNLDNDPPITGCTADCSNITDLVNIPNDVLLVGDLNAAIDEGKHYLIITTTNPDLARVGYYSAFFVKPSRFSPGGFIKRKFWQVQQ